MSKERTLLIGCGAGGNKSTLYALEHCEKIEKSDVLLINSTSRDIPENWDGKTVILSTDDKGCGKERTTAKEMTLTAIQTGKLDLKAQTEGYSKVIIITSQEGGTGSGSAPIIAKYCSQVLALNTHLIGFKGFEEDPRGLQNTIEFFQEIDPSLTVQCINNAAFLKECGNSKFKAEQLANRELAKRLRLLDGSELIASEQNIDPSDLYKAANTVGYMTIEVEPVRSAILDQSDFDKICTRMVTYSKSLKSADPGQQRMAVIMNISPANEDFIDTSFRVFKNAYGNSYETFLHKQYNPNEEEYIAVISSGQRMPLDEVKAIYDRYLQESSKVVKTKDNFAEEIMKLKGLPEDMSFDMNRTSNKKSISSDEFMKSFQTKPQSVKEVTPVVKEGGKK